MRAVVTGATNGVGEQIVLRLAQHGMTVVLVGRHDARLRAARDRIAAAVPNTELVLERADLAELSQVRALAGRLAASVPDVAVSNAALVTPLDRFTSDGLPCVLAVNHLAPYLMLRTLAPAVDHARFVVVGADPVALTRVRVDLDPFASRTRSVGREVPGIGPLVRETLHIDPADLRTPEAAADTPIWLATSSELDSITGQFFVNRPAVQTAAHTSDSKRREQLWDQSAKLVGPPARTT